MKIESDDRKCKGKRKALRCCALALAIVGLPTMPELHAQTQHEGKASYYARKFTGRKTASGEFFHHDSMTCAHRRYAFGTLLKVSNPVNGKVVVVRVNDRGPFVKGRIIDLSWKAARALGIINMGVAMVKVEPLNVNFIPFRPAERFSVPEFNFETTSERPFSLKPEWQELKDMIE